MTTLRNGEAGTMPGAALALAALFVLDSSPEPEFDALVAAAAGACQADIATIGFFDGEREWFKASVGLTGLSQIAQRQSPAAGVLASGVPVVAGDSGDTPGCANAYAPVAEVRSSVSLPIRDEAGVVVGALTVGWCRASAADASRLSILLAALSPLADAIGLALQRRARLLGLEAASLRQGGNNAAFQAICEHDRHAIVLCDAAGRAVYVNARWCDLLGVSAEDIIGRNWVGFVHPHDVERVLGAWHQAVDSPQGLRCEYRICRGDGEIRVVNGFAKQLRDADDSISGYVGLIEDVTELRSAMRRAAEGDAQLRRIYERTPALLNSTDIDNRLLTVSDLWIEHLGYAREDLLGQPLSAFMTEASRSCFERELRPLLDRDGAFNRARCEFVTSEGRLIDVLLSSVLERDAIGEPVRILSVIEDVTLRLRTEQALNEERRRLRQILEATRAGTWELNVQTGELRVNDRWREMLGEAPSGRGFGWLESIGIQLNENGRSSMRRAFTRHISGASPHFEFVQPFPRTNGQTLWILGNGRTVTWTEDRRPEWVYGTILDITESKLQEQALRKNQAFLERTGKLAGVAGWELDLGARRCIVSGEAGTMRSGGAARHIPFRTMLRAFDRRARRRLLNAVRLAVHGGETWDLTLPMRWSDGEIHWSRIVGSVSSNEGGQPQIGGAIQDVDERTRAQLALRESTERLRLATECGRIGIWQWTAGGQLKADDMALSHFGIQAEGEESLEGRLTAAIHPDDVGQVISAMVDAGENNAELCDIVYRVFRPDGSLRWLRSSGYMEKDRNGRSTHLSGVVVDITEPHLLAQQLAEQHEVLQVTLQSIGDGVITTDAQGRIRWLNPVAERLTGWVSEQAQGRRLADVVRLFGDEDDRPITIDAQGSQVLGLGPHQRLILRDQTGRAYGVECSTSPMQTERGDMLGNLLIIRDVTEHRQLSDEMRWRATRDPLTGLLNRSEFERRLSELLEQSRRDGRTHALLYVDLDQFKLVNDTGGHAVGDQLLQQLAQLFSESLRAQDNLARLGGDEFAILLRNCDVSGAQAIAQRICDRMDDFRFVFEDRRFRIGTSIGLVPIDRRWTSTDGVMQAADRCCYSAKELGRNRVHIWYDSDRTVQARQRDMTWTSRIEQALDENRFVLHAQRLAPLGAGEHGLHAEALLRMVCDDGSLSMPGAFLPAAERFHLINRIDRWVLRRVIDVMTQIPADHALSRLSMNLSGQSIGDPAFHAWAMAVLEHSGSEVCGRLCLEITETAAITNLASAVDFIAAVRDLGVAVALDDFGAGASSFGYLKRLPVDYLKIDGQFIRDLVDDPLDEAAVRCFKDVAGVIGVRTVAEFVDRPEVLERLREIGIDYAQGYHVHRPEPIDQLLAPQPLVSVAARR